MLLTLLACADKAPTTDDSTPVAGDDSAAQGPTYWGDVRPVVDRVCANCHVPGGVGDIDFTDPATAVTWAFGMAGAMESGEMPPATANPECRPWVGHERMRVSEEERQLIADWANAGAPLGDEADYEGDPWDHSRMTDADTRVEMPFEYEIQPADDGNEYACFALGTASADFAITAFDVEVGNPEVVHHMILFTDSHNDAGVEYGGADERGWFDCRNPIMEDDWSLLHAWAPGMPPTEFPEGVGLEVQEGEQLVLQVHYYDGAFSGAKDKSTYLLKTAPTVETGLKMFPLGPTDINIEAGDADAKETFSLPSQWVDITMYGVFPHMHLLGKSYRAWIDTAEGDEECVSEGQWNFHNQVTYLFEEPVVMEKGGNFNVECTWDNSAENPNQYNDPPQDVHWGEGTNQEMCFFLTYLTW